MKYLQKSFTVGGTGSAHHEVIFGRRRTLLEGDHQPDCSSYECAAGCQVPRQTWRCAKCGGHRDDIDIGPCPVCPAGRP